MSRTPVREAILRLARIGLVEIAANRFTRVTSPTPELSAQTLEYTGYQAGIAMRMALPRMTDAEAGVAIELLDQMIVASTSGDVLTLYSVSRSLYRHIASLTGNAVFATMMREAGLALERNLRGTRPMLGSTAQRDEMYRGLRAAIERRDADAAERWVREQHGLGRSRSRPRNPATTSRPDPPADAAWIG
ncbi:GntR family transcriptional regulator [Microbacterium sp. NIBRBAC000506063]|uniref:GntR family transcriptional regulator n=1 Tax=Microbacterium sp. NIBRBAC000506063 TaxID=2734618 RepID=UPI0021D445F6|nr:FCD domain-containing protein [Microbacterium sp. NIBRBAC000506063]